MRITIDYFVLDKPVLYTVVYVKVIIAISEYCL